MQNINIAISKDAVGQLPPVEYDGRIEVVDTPDKARAALRYLSRCGLVGFDTETRPSFKKGVLHNVALMQLAADDICFLFRINRIGFHENLIDFLQNPDITKVGLSVHDDFNVIRRSCPLEPQGFVELQSYVKQFSITDTALRKIYAIIFGRSISKSQRLTNWEAEELTPLQQRYAAIDAWACLKIYNALRSGAFDPLTSPYIVSDDSDIQSETNIDEQS